MRRIASGIVAASLAAGCGAASLAPFGQIENPAALALHEPSGLLFIASLGSDELRVFDAREESFLTAPAGLFPLSIPTVRSPDALAAAGRYVFVLSRAGGEIGFVDTRVPVGGAGPRSVDVGGAPLTLPLDMVATDLIALEGAWPWERDGLADHALAIGVDGESGGLLVALRPPVVGEEGEIVRLPLPEAVLELPGIYPSSIALDPSGVTARSLRGPAGEPIADCRTLAIADGRLAPGHEPAIWLTRVRIDSDGNLSVAPLDPARRMVVRVPLELPDGTIEERVAPVRQVAFAPAPLTDASLAAIAADPCTSRSGRLYAVLDVSYCGGVAVCPDVAVIDLLPEGPALATDAITGGPALYDLPSTALRVTAIDGPFSLPGAWSPIEFDEAGRGLRLTSVPSLALIAASDGVVYYLHGGFGSWLVGPTPDDRAPTDPVFPVDAEPGPPGLVGSVVRIDPGARGTDPALPTIGFPAGSRPRDERWTAGYLAPLPGLERVGRIGSIGEDGILWAPAGISFAGEVPVQANAEEPRLADRLVPVTGGQEVCEGFPVVEVGVAADGRSFVRVDRTAGFANGEGCLLDALELDVLPPLEQPFWLDGEVTGFLGRFAAGTPDDRQTRLIAADGIPLFTFTPAAGEIPPGARWRFTTTDGLAWYGADAEEIGEFPTAMVPWLRSGPRPGRDPVWRVFLTFTGTDSLIALNPAAPGDMDLFQ